MMAHGACYIALARFGASCAHSTTSSSLPPFLPPPPSPPPPPPSVATTADLPTAIHQPALVVSQLLMHVGLLRSS